MGLSMDIVSVIDPYLYKFYTTRFNPLNAKLNPICHLLTLLRAHLVLHVSRIRIKHTAFYIIIYTLSVNLTLSITVWPMPDAVDTVVCTPDNGWWYHPKHVEQIPYKRRNVASCWIYIRICLKIFQNFRRAAQHAECLRNCSVAILAYL